MVVYRATPADVASGVLVGDLEYPGLSRVRRDASTGVKIADPAVRIAFFALRYDQDLNTPIRLFARDEAGNTARADFDFRTFPKPFKKSRIELDDKFLDRVVPAILAGHDRGEARGGHAREVPRDQRRAAAEERREDRVVREADRPRDAVARRRLPSRSRTTPSSRRSPISGPTSTRARKSISRCTSGFDLASFAGTPIVAANRGKVRLRRRARHLRQLRDHRSRHGRAVALRAPVGDRRQGRATWSRRSSSSAAAA